MASSPRAAAAQYSRVGSHSVSGRGKSARISASHPTQHEGGRLGTGVTAVDAHPGTRYLSRGLAPQLAHDLHHVGDAEHVGVRQETTVGVVGQDATVVVEGGALDECPAMTLGTEPHVLDLH